MTTTSSMSTPLIAQAINDHLTTSGTLLKSIAIDSGLAPNYVSMLRKGTTRLALGKVVALRRALPELDANMLTAVLIREKLEKAERSAGDVEQAEQAMIDLFNFLNADTSVMEDIRALTSEVEAECRENGLWLPERLPADLRGQIADILRQAAQREAKLAYASVHDA